MTVCTTEDTESGVHCGRCPAATSEGVSMKAVLVAVLALAAAAPTMFAQGRGAATQPPPQPTPPATQPARPRPAAPKPITPRVTVRDQSGTGVPGAKLTLSGAVSAEFTTD